jgi:hypothetical protein
MQIFVHPLGIMQQGKALTSIKKQRAAVPLDQGTEPMLTQSTGNGANRIFTQNGYSILHLPLRHSLLLTAGILGKFRDAHLLQNGEQRAKLGKAGLKQVQTHKTGKPEPVLMMEVG